MATPNITTPHESTSEVKPAMTTPNIPKQDVGEDQGWFACGGEREVGRGECCRANR
jgi:hypothetical protein